MDRVDRAVWRRRIDVKLFWLHDLQILLLDVLPKGVLTNGLMTAMMKKRDAFKTPYEKSRKL